jgi:hypothetical protein
MTTTTEAAPSADKRSQLERWSFPQRLYAALLRRLARWFGIKVFWVYGRPLAADQDVPACLNDDYSFAQMSETELMRYADDPVFQLPRDFVRAAVASGDPCFGVLYRGRLVAYRWYGLTGSTPCDEGLLIRYAEPGCVYGYKAFTHPEHRGRRLHLYTMKESDSRLMDRGFTRAVGYIETHNFASLRNNSRLRGVQTIGWVVTLRILGRRLVINSPGLSRHKVSMATER